MQKTKEATKRFQECNKIEKLWRYRWYLTIPFVAFYSWFRCQFEDFEDENLDWTEWNLHWSLAISFAQMKMEWYHTHTEVETRFKNSYPKEDDFVDPRGDEDDDDFDNYGDHNIY
jgi:hypothetical protein